MEKRNAYDVLKERGFVEQMTHEEEIRQLFSTGEPITFYIGFDPTADSLHVGHFLTVMAMAHMQRCGHRPICLMGGGTGMIGDPTGKSDMRRMMTIEEIDHNVSCFKKQLSHFIDFDNDKAIIVNNADWLRNLNYIEFLREIGVSFSVNRMLTAECFKTRMEKGLSFLEFNYMIMQAYDFLELNKRYGCVLQLGGNDQWSNIIAGVDLIRRRESKPAYGMTFSLLTNSEGKKMGKTENGAVWLDPAKTSPYEFYQYWRNIADEDVKTVLSLITFLPMEQIEELCAHQDERMNEAKKVAAFEITKLIHGEGEAKKAEEAANALFEGNGSLDNMPTSKLESLPCSLLDAMILIGFAPSKGQARTLIEQGGITLNDEKVSDTTYQLSEKDFEDGYAILRKGKKVYHKLEI